MQGAYQVKLVYMLLIQLHAVRYNAPLVIVLILIVFVIIISEIVATDPSSSLFFDSSIMSNGAVYMVGAIGTNIAIYRWTEATGTTPFAKMQKGMSPESLLFEMNGIVAFSIKNDSYLIV